MNGNAAWTGDRPIARVPFVYRRRMHWGDGDGARIGFTGKFVEYAIEACEAWWEATLGTGWLRLHEERKLGTPAVSLHFDFVHPVKPGAFVDLEVRVERLGRSSLTLAILARLVDGPPCFSALFTSVLVDPEAMRATPYPDDLRRRIERYRRGVARADRGIRDVDEVLAFWFGPDDDWRDLWFKANARFDDAVRQRFLATWQAAAAGELDEWTDDAAGSLALTIVLDQFPRNIFRGERRAYASDGKAREIARRALAAGHADGLPLHRASFLYLPFEHSEDLEDQRTCMALFGRHAGEARFEDTLDYVRRHLEIVERFGRFPHRNAVLGRASTAEELAFLAQPGSSF